MYSFHNFMLPFQWSIQGYDDRMFSEQVGLRNIHCVDMSNWERVTCPEDSAEKNDLYNERNYFFDFVHNALYDTGREDTLLWHFERKETRAGRVSYVIDCGSKVYELKVKAINLNLFSTGVGVLSFHLGNDRYPDLEDVLHINQVGRRIYPPFIASLDKKENGHRAVIAESIQIKGLDGDANDYREDFTRYTSDMEHDSLFASFVTALIHDVADNLTLRPVVDDRMFVQCWYKNDQLTAGYMGDGYKRFIDSDEWYEFVFADEKGWKNCYDPEMQHKLISEATYPRWRQKGSLYGITRNTMMFLTGTGASTHLFETFETIYARMAELVLVQKASVLRFSTEINHISKMDEKKGFGDKVSSLYKEYIRFVNQIHFREISPQDMGRDLYKMFYDTINLEKHVEKLDDEIEELYNYVSLSEDRKNNKTLGVLTWFATIAVPMTVVAGIFGMNNTALTGTSDAWYNHIWPQIFLILGITGVVFIIAVLLLKNKGAR